MKFTIKDIQVGRTFRHCEGNDDDWEYDITILAIKNNNVEVLWGDGQSSGKLGYEITKSQIVNGWLNLYKYKLDKSDRFASLYQKLSS